MTGLTLPGAVHLGMDMSKDTIVVAVLLPGEELSAVDRIVNREEAVRRLIGRCPGRERLRACYEAGPGESLFTFVAGELPPPSRWRWLIRVVVTTIPARAGRREFDELGRQSGDLLVEAIE